MGQHLSDYLKTHARTRDLSASEFARVVGIGKSSAAEILAGRSTPEERTLKKIADACGMAFAQLSELALLDTPFELQPGAQLLSMKERAFVRAAVDQLLESSGKADRVDQLKSDRLKPDGVEYLRQMAKGNVVEMPRPQRVQKAAYNPPDEG